MNQPRNPSDADDSAASDERTEERVDECTEEHADERTDPESPSQTAEPGEPTQGVGPWPGGRPAWPNGDQYDPDLLEHGDRRNVVDAYRYWRLEAIVADLDSRRHSFHVAIENWGRDFNIGSVVRSANAFGAAAVHIVGRRRWNRRGAMVTDRYQHVYHHPEVEDLVQWAQERDLPIIGIDNLPGSVPLEHRPLPRACVLLFGAEQSGLSPAAQRASAEIVHITQYGSTRSINAGAAAAVAMYHWALQHAGSPHPLRTSSSSLAAQLDPPNDRPGS